MFGNNHTALFSNSRGWKTLYTSHSTVFRLLWVINDNGHLPKYKLSSQTGFRNTSWWMWTNIFFFFCGMYLFINKMKDTLKFHLHIVMHESTALAMPCTERKGIDSINQKMQSYFSEPQELCLLIPFQPKEFFQRKYCILHMYGFFVVIRLNMKERSLQFPPWEPPHYFFP